MVMCADEREEIVMRWCLIAVAAIVVACGGDSEDELNATEYKSEVRDACNATEIQTVADKMVEAGSQPALFLNESWKTDTLAALETWRDLHETISDIEPPSEAQTAHDAALLASECL